jgi:hypothetical protein
MTVSRKPQVGRFAALALAVLFTTAWAPSVPSLVDLEAVLQRPQLYDGKVIRVTACIKQAHHGVLLGRCKSDGFETAVFSDHLSADQRQAFLDAAAKT